MSFLSSRYKFLVIIVNPHCSRLPCNSLFSISDFFECTDDLSISSLVSKTRFPWNILVRAALSFPDHGDEHGCQPVASVLVKVGKFSKAEDTTMPGLAILVDIRLR